MSDFDVASTLSISVSNSEIRQVRQDIERGLSDIQVGITAGNGGSSQPRDPETGQFMGIEGAEQRIVEQTAILEDMRELASTRTQALSSGSPLSGSIDAEGQASESVTAMRADGGDNRQRTRRRREHRWARRRTEDIEEILEILEQSDLAEEPGGGLLSGPGLGLGALLGAGVGGGILTRLLTGARMGAGSALIPGLFGRGGFSFDADDLAPTDGSEMIRGLLGFDPDEPIIVQLEVRDQTDGLLDDLLTPAGDDDEFVNQHVARAQAIQEQLQEEELTNIHLEYQHAMREEQAENDLIAMHEEFQESLRNDPLGIHFEPDETMEALGQAWHTDLQAQMEALQVPIEPDETLEVLGEAWWSDIRAQQQHSGSNGRVESESDVNMNVTVDTQQVVNEIQDMVGQVESAIQEAERVVESDVRDLETRVSEIERAQRFATQ